MNERIRLFYLLFISYLGYLIAMKPPNPPNIPDCFDQIPLFKDTKVFYGKGDCCRDKESECVGLATAAYTTNSPISGVSHMDSIGFTGMVAHENGILEFIGCSFNNKLTSAFGPVGSNSGSSKLSIYDFEAVVLDEQPDPTNGDGAYLTLIAARYAGEDLSTKKYGTGMGFLLFNWNLQGTLQNLYGYGVQDVKPPVRFFRKFMNLAVGPGQRLYYFVRGDRDPREFSIHWAQQIDYAFFNSNSGKLKAIKTLPEFEKLLTVVSSDPGPYVYFALCDCRLAVSYDCGKIDIYCCDDLHKLYCSIPSPCNCDCDDPIPWTLKWCCKTKTLFVLHRSVSPGSLGNSFIRAYEIGSDSMYRCYKELYTIKGCVIRNFRVCCEEDDAIVYVILEMPGNGFYIRTYLNGKLSATRKLPYRPRKDIMVLSGSPTKKEWHGSLEKRSDFDTRCGFCGHCGVLVPFEVLNKEESDDLSILINYQPVGCFCAKL